VESVLPLMFRRTPTSSNGDSDQDTFKLSVFLRLVVYAGGGVAAEVGRLEGERMPAEH